jgi:precorrin-2/cobalt-factor-2 C20-methyltransferase
MKLYVIGLGPGDPELVTVKAKKIIENCRLIFVPSMKSDFSSRAYLAALPYISKSTSMVPLFFPYFSDPELEKTLASNVHHIISGLQQYKKAAFLVIGDPSLYSTYFQIHHILQKDFPEVDIEITPGLSAFQLALSRLQISALGKTQTLSVVAGGTNQECISALLAMNDTVVIYKMNQLPNLAEIEAVTQGYAVRKICSELGTSRETIQDLNPESISHQYGYFSLMILKKH